MTPVEELMPNEAIENALAVIRQRIDEQEREYAELAKRIAAGKEEEHLLRRILAVRRGEGPTGSIASQNKSEHTAVKPGSGGLLDIVAEELRLAGRPLHISDLMRLLGLRHMKIPGAGTQANLITYMRRDQRFIRAARGVYALAEWGLDEMPPSRRRKRRRRTKAAG